MRVYNSLSYPSTRSSFLRIYENNLTSLSCSDLWRFRGDSRALPRHIENQNPANNSEDEASEATVEHCPGTSESQKFIHIDNDDDDDNDNDDEVHDFASQSNNLRNRIERQPKGVGLEKMEVHIDIPVVI